MIVHNEHTGKVIDQLVLCPHIAVVFRPFTGCWPVEIEEWLEATMPGRWYWLANGHHEFQFSQTTPGGASSEDTYAYPIVFDSASDLMLFKLTWSGAA